jgi:uncharacterized protein (UPF0332 family)
MSLESWSANGWIDRHTASDSEIAALVETAEHAIQQAEQLQGLSSAWKLKMAYDAILSCARAALFEAGYRASRTGDHYREIQSLEFTLGLKTETLDRLNTLRMRRNTATYESYELIGQDEADSALTEARTVLGIVRS